MSIVLFEMDGTLIESTVKNGRHYSEIVFLPNVKERIAQLNEMGCIMGIITNQGGAAFGYYTEVDAVAKIKNVLFELGIRLNRYRVCVAHPNAMMPEMRREKEWRKRKPSGWMIKDFCMEFSRKNNEESLYVGDHEDDMRAAADAGVRFQWADEFFGRKEV